jgi:hypothetical protein
MRTRTWADERHWPSVLLRVWPVPAHESTHVDACMHACVLRHVAARCASEYGSFWAPTVHWGPPHAVCRRHCTRRCGRAASRPSRPSYRHPTPGSRTHMALGLAGMALGRAGMALGHPGPPAGTPPPAHARTWHWAALAWHWAVQALLQAPHPRLTHAHGTGPRWHGTGPRWHGTLPSRPSYRHPTPGSRTWRGRAQTHTHTRIPRRPVRASQSEARGRPVAWAFACMHCVFVVGPKPAKPV